MVILIGTLLGIGCGCAFGVIISRIIINTRMTEFRDEELRILDKKLSIVAERCDNTQKACRLLSEEVKRLNKIIEKEIPPATQEETFQEKNNSAPLTNNGFSCNESLSEPLQDIANSIRNSLQQIRNNENLTSQNLVSMINCYNANVMGNLELMTKWGVSTEEAQRRIFYALYPGWRLPDED